MEELNEAIAILRKYAYGNFHIESLKLATAVYVYVDPRIVNKTDRKRLIELNFIPDKVNWLYWQYVGKVRLRSSSQP